MNDPLQVLEDLRAGIVRRERMLRIATFAVIGIGLSAVTRLILSIGHMTGWLPKAAWIPDLMTSSLIFATFAGSASLVFNPREKSLVKQADNRLGLNGALLTAWEVRNTCDPICRLLIRRTAAVITPSSLKKAVPVRLHGAVMVIPALVFAAAGLGIDSKPPSSPVAPLDNEPNPDLLAFSGELRSATSALLASRFEGVRLDVHSLQHLLEIESAVRRGELTLYEAREKVARWLKLQESLERTIAAADEMRSDGASYNIAKILEKVRSLATAGTGPIAVQFDNILEPIDGGSGDGRLPPLGEQASLDSLVGGLGQGTGAGMAPAGEGGQQKGSGWHQQSGRSQWSLPRPNSLTGSTTDRDETTIRSSGGALAGRKTGSFIHAFERRLTHSERLLVDAYIDAMQRRDVAETAD